MSKSKATTDLPTVALIERIQGSHGGKPTAVITPAGLVVIRDMARDGASQNLIAARLGLNRSTFREVFNRQDEARVAWEHGAAEEEMALVASLRAAAAKGNIVASLFLLKTRHGYVEGAPQAETKQNITIVLPDAYSPESYMRVINEPAAPAVVTRPPVRALRHNSSEDAQ